MVPVACTEQAPRRVRRGVAGPRHQLRRVRPRHPEGTHRACRTLIAKYAKVPDNGDLQYRAGSIYYHPYEREWRNGNRGVQCFLWVSDRNLTRSVKGAGAKGLPVT